LAAADYPWPEVDVLLTDERCVPVDHPDSNARMVHEALVSRLDAPPRVYAMPGATCDAARHELGLRMAFGELRLDMVVLGLGRDGHTASLFPDQAALDERVRWVVRVDRPDHPRITLTPAHPVERPPGGVPGRRGGEARSPPAAAGG
jgi:6-phosphogluconolactonase